MNRHQTLALVDVNNFYASCERLFRPDLAHKPVLVLSNNDASVIARSKEVKALGIKMGMPAFQIEHLVRKHNIHCFSSNYALYADMSARVMSTLEQLTPRIEVYSIDEAFADLTGTEHLCSLEEYGQDLKDKIAKWVGLPVCVGIAPTKTLAKLANHGAKTYPGTKGVVDLTDPQRQEKLMKLVPVGEVWGVGSRISKRLNALGITTAYELSRYNPRAARGQFSVVLERTIRELNGESCIELEEAPPTKQQIICSRSFGRKIKDYEVMREALCSYTARAIEKLRAEQREAKMINVFIRTSPFIDPQQQYSNSATRVLELPSADSRDFIRVVTELLTRLWRDGFEYAKAGVMISDFYEPGTQQIDMFSDDQGRPKSRELMNAIDSINGSGLGKVFYAAQGTARNWTMKREKLSPAYTTRWSDLPKVI